MQRGITKRRSLCTGNAPVFGEPLERRLLLAATLIKDINTLPSSTVVPAPLTPAGGSAYFAGHDAAHGSELWKTDGTAGGTSMVKDIRSGAAPSSPTSITNVNGVAYFVADDGVHGAELWRSNGSDGGTTLVKDINPGSAGAAPSLLTAAGSGLYFFADDGAAGRELWRSDGTPGGTSMVSDLRAGSGGQNPTGMAVTSDGTVYFTATNGTNAKSGLWRTDGTIAGTTFVKGVFNNLTGGVVNVYASGMRVFFVDSSNGIWAGDGTPAGMVQVQLASGPSTFHDWVFDGNGLGYFVRENSGSGLYRIDGTTVQPILYAGNGSKFTDARDLTMLNGRLYFVATESENGREVHYLVPGKTVALLLKDAYPGTGTDSPDNLAAVNGLLYFTSGQSFSGYSLWHSDGTAAGTVNVGTVASPTARPPSDAIGLGSSYLFVNDDGVNGPELWRSDGTAPGTALVKAIYPGTQSSTPVLWGEAGGAMLFTVKDSASGAVSLWRTDGTAGGTAMVYSAWPSTTAPRNWRVVGNRIFFAAGDSATTGIEPWVTDGTTAGTKMLKDIYANGSSSPSGFTGVGAWAYFAATDPTHGTELWRTDGTPTGTTMVVDLKAGSANGMSTLTPPVSMNGLLYFSGVTGTTAPELWRSDGTAAGTSLVLSASGSGTPGSIRFGVVSNGTLYFGRGDSLWRSDGTTVGTVLLKDFNAPLTSEGVVDSLVQMGSSIYFAAVDAAGVRGLWRTDGTAAGTTLLAAISPKFLTVAGGKLFFFKSGVQPADGTTLWTSDGIPGGTLPVARVTEVTDSSYPSAPTVANGRLFFVTKSSNAGAELWTTDGTPEGTGIVQDLNAGADDGVAGLPVTGEGGTIYLTGNDGISGFEPYRVPDTFAPIVQSPEFKFYGPHALSMSFNEDVSASMAAGDLVITNTATGATVDPSFISRAYDSSTQTATFTFPGLASGMLPDGNYSASFKSGSVTDAAGNGVSPAFAFTFFMLGGDANRDGAVDFNDLVKLAQNYNTTGGKTYADGDFNGDDKVDFNDLVIMAQRYNTRLPGAPASAAVPASSLAADWEAAFVTVPAATAKDVKKKPNPIFSLTPVAKPAPVKPTPPQRRK